MAESWAEIEADVRRRVMISIGECKTKSQRCTVRASQALRASALLVLGGKRGGRTYRRMTGGKSTYKASAPGQPPAVRSGTLMHSWSMYAVGNGNSFTAGIRSDVPYAHYLEDGTSKMAARPFKDKIIETATPEIKRIFSEITK